MYVHTYLYIYITFISIRTNPNIPLKDRLLMYINVYYICRQHNPPINGHAGEFALSKNTRLRSRTNHWFAHRVVGPAHKSSKETVLSGKINIDIHRPYRTQLCFAFFPHNLIVYSCHVDFRVFVACLFHIWQHGQGTIEQST